MARLKRTGWPAAAAGALVGAIFVVRDYGVAAINSAEGVARLLGGAMAAAIVFGLIGYVFDLWRGARVRRRKD